MAQDKPDWFKMNPAMFLQDSLVDAMSTEELGMAFRLLCRQWIDGWIPDDLDLLARLCRTNRSSIGVSWETVLSKFFPELEPGKRANRFMWQERELVAQAMAKKRNDGRVAVTKRWDAIRAGKDTNREPIANLIQEKEKEKEKEKDSTTPTPSAPLPGKSSKPKKQPAWKVAHSTKVIEATMAILDIWPTEGLQPEMNGTRSKIPATSGADLAARLGEIEKDGGDLGICLEIASAFVEKWKSGKVWMKAAQYYFGKRDDAPWQSHYKAYITNQQMGDNT